MGGETFVLDLLVSHKRLRCSVVLDRKMRDFTPESAGTMPCYLHGVDDRLRDAHDHPSIGLILRRSKNPVEAEYALRGVASPIGVAEYQVTTPCPRTAGRAPEFGGRARRARSRAAGQPRPG